MQSKFPRFRVSLLAMALLLLAPLTALAAPGLHGHAEGKGMGEDGRMLEHLMYRLELSESQIEEVHTLVEPRQAEFEALHEQMVTARGAMMNAIHAETFDETAIREAAAAKGDVDAELGVARAMLLNEVRTVLTGDQLAELNEMFAEMENYHEDHPGGGHGGVHRRHARPDHGGR